MSAHRTLGVWAWLRCHIGRDDDASQPMDDRHLWNVLVRYCADDLKTGESERLQAWSTERAGHARLLRGVARIVSVSRERPAVDHTAEAWARFEGRIETEGAQAQNAPQVRALRLHATPVVAQPVAPPVAPRHVSSRRGLRRMQMVRPPTRSRFVALSAMAAALIVAVGLGRLTAAVQRQPAQMREYVTHGGERADLGLPDGSRVVLGADSKLRLSLARFTHERTLYLQGIAHFSVAHDPSRPFTVFAGGAATQAVGTEFSVAAYPEDSVVQVVVAKGRVLLRPKEGASGTGTALERGDLGRFHADGVTSLQHGVDVDRYLGWMHGHLAYNLTPVSVIVRDLERWYDVAITVDDSSLNTVRVTVSFNRNGSPADALQRLADVLNVRLVKSGRNIRLVPARKRTGS